MSKQEIRQEIRKQRDRYQFIHRDSVRIWDILEQSSLYKKARTIFTYCSFGSEVETFFTLEPMMRHGKKVCLPRLKDKSYMEFHVLEHLKRLERNRYGVYEPPMWEATCVPAADSLMLVPGVAFDLQGNRIGFGGGFYDCYLQRHPQTRTMGICFDFQLLEGTIPVEETDQKLQYILTTRGIYNVEEGVWL